MSDEIELIQITKTKRTLKNLGAVQCTGAEKGGSGIYAVLSRDTDSDAGVISVAFHKQKIFKTEWGVTKSSTLTRSKPSMNFALDQARKLYRALEILLAEADKMKLLNE